MPHSNGPWLWDMVQKELLPYFTDPTIAGGALRDYLLNCLEPRDIDVFVSQGGGTVPGWLVQSSQSLHPEEYEARYNVGGIWEGLFLDHKIQVIYTDCPDPDELLRGFDFGINRTFYRDSQIFDTWSAYQDRQKLTATLISDHSLEQSQKRFKRLQERYPKLQLINPFESYLELPF